MESQAKVKISDKAEGIIERDMQNSVIGRREISLKKFIIWGAEPHPGKI